MDPLGLYVLGAPNHPCRQLMPKRSMYGLYAYTLIPFQTPQSRYTGLKWPNHGLTMVWDGYGFTGGLQHIHPCAATQIALRLRFLLKPVNPLLHPIYCPENKLPLPGALPIGTQKSTCCCQVSVINFSAVSLDIWLKFRSEELTRTHPHVKTCAHPNSLTVPFRPRAHSLLELWLHVARLVLPMSLSLGRDNESLGAAQAMLGSREARQKGHGDIGCHRLDVY